MRILKVVIPSRENDPVMYRRMGRLLKKHEEELFEDCDEREAFEEWLDYNVIESMFNLPDGVRVIEEGRDVFYILIENDEHWKPPKEVLNSFKVYEIRSWKMVR